MAAAKEQSKKLDYLQALRALAIVVVLLNHYPGDILIGKHGYVGVDLFFVISGYIMVHTTRDSDGSLAYLKTFYLKRLTRIWPAYAVVSLVMLFLCNWHRIGYVVANTRWYLESVLFVPLWVRQPIDKPGWTLTFEMYFYFIFGLSLLGGTRRWWVFASIILLTLIGIPFVCTWLGIVYARAADGIGGYGAIVTNSIVWDFVIGVGTGILAGRHIRFGDGRLTGALIVICVSVMAFIYFGYTLGHGARPWGIAFGVLVVLLDLHNTLQPIKVPRPILYIGDISYSLYLTNMIVTGIYNKYIPVQSMPALWRIGLVAPYLGAILLLGTLSYRILERGLSEKVRRYFLS